MRLKINWDHKRCRHAIERMWLRGISSKEVEEGIIKGRKTRQKRTKLIESFHQFYSVVYDETIYGSIRKVYPITIKLW